MDLFWIVSIIKISLIVGISLIVIGIDIIIKKRRIKILLIGIGIGLVFISFFLPGIISYLKTKYSENECVGSYMLEGTITNPILTLSDDMTFEFKQIDTIHVFGHGTWKWKEGDNAPYIELTFMKSKDTRVLFSIRHKNEKTVLEQLSNKNRLTLVEK